MSKLGDGQQLCAGIILYNPDEKRLQDNIKSIIQQVSHIFIIDNASSNIDVIEKKYKGYCKITIVKNAHNYGIAYALNQACELADEHHYKWILTLDQDSVCPSDLIQQFIPFTQQDNVGIICPRFVLNIVGKQEKRTKVTAGYCYIKYCITSASLTRLAAWSKCGKFDERLFIDCVDYDFCIKLRLANYKILQVNDVFINHEVGNATYLSICGNFGIVLYNHNSTRNYYIVRNTLLLVRKYYYLFDVYIWLPRLLKWEICKILLEKDRWLTIKSLLRGIKDGLKL